MKPGHVTSVTSAAQPSGWNCIPSTRCPARPTNCGDSKRARSPRLAITMDGSTRWPPCERQARRPSGSGRVPAPDDYISYEFEWGFIYNVEAGEDIRVLDLTDQPGPGLPDHDFWLFDDQTVVQMLYRPDGTQIGRELLADPDLDTYLGYQDKAWCGSVPFGDYLAGLAPRV